MAIERDHVLAELEVIVPRLVEVLHADGTLEAAVRARLEPFFNSPAVAAILDEAPVRLRPAAGEPGASVDP